MVCQCHVTGSLGQNLSPGFPWCLNLPKGTLVTIMATSTESSGGLSDRHGLLTLDLVELHLVYSILECVPLKATTSMHQYQSKSRLFQPFTCAAAFYPSSHCFLPCFSNINYTTFLFEFLGVSCLNLLDAICSISVATTLHIESKMLILQSITWIVSNVGPTL